MLIAVLSAALTPTFAFADANLPYKVNGVFSEPVNVINPEFNTLFKVDQNEQGVVISPEVTFESGESSTFADLGPNATLSVNPNGGAHLEIYRLNNDGDNGHGAVESTASPELLGLILKAGSRFELNIDQPGSIVALYDNTGDSTHFTVSNGQLWWNRDDDSGQDQSSLTVFGNGRAFLWSDSVGTLNLSDGGRVVALDYSAELGRRAPLSPQIITGNYGSFVLESGRHDRFSEVNVLNLPRSYTGVQYLGLRFSSKKAPKTLEDTVVATTNGSTGTLLPLPFEETIYYHRYPLELSDDKLQWLAKDKEAISPEEKPSHLVQAALGSVESQWATFHDLNDAVNNQLMHAVSNDPGARAQLWVSASEAHQRKNDGLSFKDHQQTYEFGVNYPLNINASTWVGASVQWLDDKVTTADADNKRQWASLSLFGKTAWDNGWALNAIARFGQIHQQGGVIDFEDDLYYTRRHLDLSRNNPFFMTADVGVSKDFALTDTVKVQPSLTVQYAHGGRNSFDAYGSMKIKNPEPRPWLPDYIDQVLQWHGAIEPINSLVSRVGLEINYRSEQAKDWSIASFARVNWNHEYLGKTRLTIKPMFENADEDPLDWSFKQKKSWMTLAVGSEVQWKQHWSFFAQGQWQFKGLIDRGWRLNLGANYRF